MNDGSIAVRDLAFYEAGCASVRGPRRVIVPFRRLLRRVLRPIFLHLDSELSSLNRRLAELDQRHAELSLRCAELDHQSAQLDQRQNELYLRQSRLDQDVNSGLTQCQDRVDRDLKTMLAMGWDHVAIARRLAAIEDHVEALLSQEADRDSNEFSDRPVKALMSYPDANGQRGEDGEKRVVGV